MPSFRLLPFPAAPTSSGSGSGPSVAGEVTRGPRELGARFHVVASPGGALIIPARAAALVRRDGLWQSTCLELFVGLPGEPGYLEVNVAPSGDWNVYRFTGYREGMAPLAEAVLTVGEVQAAPEDALALTFTLVLPAPWASARALELGVSAVLEASGGEKSYWALAHPGPRPDFHRRDAFLLHLGAPGAAGS